MPDCMDEVQSKIYRGKVNNKKSYNDLSCRYCKDESQAPQEHIETCEGCVFERRGLDMSEGVGDLLEKDDCQNQCCGCLMVHWHYALSDFSNFLVVS